MRQAYGWALISLVDCGSWGCQVESYCRSLSLNGKLMTGEIVMGGVLQALYLLWSYWQFNWPWPGCSPGPIAYWGATDSWSSLGTGALHVSSLTEELELVEDVLGEVNIPCWGDVASTIGYGKCSPNSIPDWGVTSIWIFHGERWPSYPVLEVEFFG